MSVFDCVRFRRSALGIALGWVLASACGVGPAASRPTTTPQSTLAATLRPLVEQTMRELRVPGAVVAVVVPGRGSWTQAFGVADLKTGAGMRTDEHVRIGSITKTVVLTNLTSGPQSERPGPADAIARAILPWLS